MVRLIFQHFHSLYRLYLGIADGMSFAWVWAGTQNARLSMAVIFEYQHAHTRANGHAVGDADIEPT